MRRWFILASCIIKTDAVKLTLPLKLLKYTHQSSFEGSQYKSIENQYFDTLHFFFFLIKKERKKKGKEIKPSTCVIKSLLESQNESSAKNYKFLNSKWQWFRWLLLLPGRSFFHLKQFYSKVSPVYSCQNCKNKRT